MTSPTGGPYPPPPGVSMRTTSPARSVTVTLSGRRVARDGSPPGSSQFSPDAPGSPPASPHGALAATLGDEGEGRVLEELELALDAVPAPVCARAAGSRAEHVAAHPERQRPFERLDRRVGGVGHGGVHAAHAVGPRPGTLAAAERLVVRPPAPAEQHVVHRALPGRAEPAGERGSQRAEAHVGDPLADLDVAGADRDGGDGGDDRAGRGDDGERAGRRRRWRARWDRWRPAPRTRPR